MLYYWEKMSAVGFISNVAQLGVTAVQRWSWAVFVFLNVLCVGSVGSSVTNESANSFFLGCLFHLLLGLPGLSQAARF